MTEDTLPEQTAAGDTPPEPVQKETAPKTKRAKGDPPRFTKRQTRASEAHLQHPIRTKRVGKAIRACVEEAGITEGRILEIGGRSNPYRELFSNFDYVHLDLEQTGEDVIVADITQCPDIPSESFDVILSVDVFEHINRPWKAAEEITRLLKPGGLTYHSTLFAWRYHPCPIDYWRFSPACMEFLFSDLESVVARFDKTERRRNITGNGRHRLKEDAFGGWRENWRIHYAGRKPAATA